MNFYMLRILSVHALSQISFSDEIPSFSKGFEFLEKDNKLKFLKMKRKTWKLKSKKSKALLK